MKKLKYERPEVEVELLDPKLDIITISGDDGDTGWGKTVENDIIGL